MQERTTEAVLWAVQIAALLYILSINLFCMILPQLRTPGVLLGE